MWTGTRSMEANLHLERQPLRFRTADNVFSLGRQNVCPEWGSCCTFHTPFLLYLCWMIFSFIAFVLSHRANSSSKNIGMLPFACDKQTDCHVRGNSLSGGQDDVRCTSNIWPVQSRWLNYKFSLTINVSVFRYVWSPLRISEFDFFPRAVTQGRGEGKEEESRGEAAWDTLIPMFDSVGEIWETSRVGVAWRVGRAFAYDMLEIKRRGLLPSDSLNSPTMRSSSKLKHVARAWRFCDPSQVSQWWDLWRKRTSHCELASLPKKQWNKFVTDFYFFNKGVMWIRIYPSARSVRRQLRQ